MPRCRPLIRPPPYVPAVPYLQPLHLHTAHRTRPLPEMQSRNPLFRESQKDAVDDDESWGDLTDADAFNADVPFALTRCTITTTKPNKRALSLSPTPNWDNCEVFAPIDSFLPLFLPLPWSPTYIRNGGSAPTFREGANAASKTVLGDTSLIRIIFAALACSSCPMRDIVSFLLVCRRWAIIGTWVEAFLFALALRSCFFEVQTTREASYLCKASPDALKRKHLWHETLPHGGFEVNNTLGLLSRFTPDTLQTWQESHQFNEHFFYLKPVPRLIADTSRVVFLLFSPVPLLPPERMSQYWKETMIRRVLSMQERCSSEQRKPELQGPAAPSCPAL